MIRIGLLVAFALCACYGGDENAGEGPTTESDRIFQPVAIDSLWSLGEQADSSFGLLWSPRGAPGGGVYVADIVHARLHYVDAAGKLVWSYGRRGQGPGELLEVRVLDVDAHGNAVIIDNLNRRIVTVGRDGNLIRERPLAREVGHASAVAVLATGNLAVAHMSGPWALLSADGDLLEAIEPPWEGFADKPFLELVGRAIAVRGTDRWVYSFDTAGEWIVFDGAEVVGRYPHIEPLPFSGTLVTETPTGGVMTSYDGSPTHTTLDLAVREDTLFVLFHGATEHRGRVVDRYDVNSGDYLGSVLLPGRASGVAVGDDGRIYTVGDSQLFFSITALGIRNGGRDSE